MRRLVLFLIAVPLLGQPWSGVLSSSRAIDWRNAGAVPGTPGALPDATWTQCGSTVAAGSSVTTINSALTACTAGHYVLLAAGTYSGLSGAINVSVNQTELRGSGSNSTLLVASSEGSCNGIFSQICMAGSNSYPNGGEQNHATWTSGFSQGATSITLSNSLNIVANSTIIALDQQDEAADTGGIWNCAGTTACGGSGSSGLPRTDNTCSSGVSPNVGACSQVQYVLVTACSPSCNNSGSTVLTTTPGLYAPNWRSGQSTGAWWATTVAYQRGVRDISIDDTSTTAGTTPIVILNCYECFAFQNRTIDGARNHFNVEYSKNITLMSNYMFNDSVNGTSSYAMEFDDVSDALVANNICQQVVECYVLNGGDTGMVEFGDFAVYPIPTNSSLPPMIFDHASGTEFNLSESNSVNAITEDNTHGTHHFFTYFRNISPGYSANGAGAPYASQTTPFTIYGGARYGNLLYNVLGQAGYHTTLSYIASGACSNGWTIVYIIGCGATGATFCTNPASCGGGTSIYDTLTNTSMMAYDNWDVVSAASHTISTAASFNDATGSPSSYIGMSSPSAAPSSFVFSSKPSFFGSVPYPAVGPDVTGGNLGICSGGTYAASYATSSGQCTGGTLTASAFGGHANANPAMSCYLNTMSGPPDGSGSVLSFNAAACYGPTPSGGVPSSVFGLFVGALH